ncbi:hypothetical protein [Chondromyces crocatus]|uniref:DUF2169 domain-containing protein n=1 Tax=Chondromyces crocatus TaxID=52 RepID=A0A0K1EIC2_CHOCO|nr:hypothetical protein [Chondromyces crocatus]AKT40606.1 uncharacterized protein CMC5_047620 [Chondromyces crocatus]
MDKPFRRILVAEAPVRFPGERRGRLLPCRVGVLPWSVEQNWLTIVVGTCFRFEPASARRPLLLDPMAPGPFHAGPSRPERPHIDDFVPLRLAVDLTVTGHVEIMPAPSGHLQARRLEVGLGERRSVVFVHAEAPGRIPLQPSATRTPEGRAIDLGPQPCHDGSTHRFHHDAEFVLDVYQAATPPLRYALDEMTALFLRGFWGDPDELVEIALPEFEPRALVDYTQASVRRGDVRLFFDGVAVDVDRGTVDITWRGLVETTATPHLDVDRIVIGWATPDQWQGDRRDAWDDVLRELPRGGFQWAVERDDVLRGEAPPPLGREALAMARFEACGHRNAAEPELEPEVAAAVAAELAEGRWPRAEVLARHGIDDYAWGIEERAWTQYLASVREGKEGGIGAAYREAFERASEALATPAEARITPAQYVTLAARLARGEGTRALAAAGLGLGGFGRVERRFRNEASQNAVVAAELKELRAREEARHDKRGLPPPSAGTSPGDAAAGGDGVQQARGDERDGEGSA